jgi:hypothetical protein
VRPCPAHPGREKLRRVRSALAAHSSRRPRRYCRAASAAAPLRARPHGGAHRRPTTTAPPVNVRRGHDSAAGTGRLRGQRVDRPAESAGDDDRTGGREAITTDGQKTAEGRVRDDGAGIEQRGVVDVPEIDRRVEGARREVGRKNRPTRSTGWRQPNSNSHQEPRPPSSS